eukprot:151034-Hanusia_phi.AAC.2
MKPGRIELPLAAPAASSLVSNDTSWISVYMGSCCLRGGSVLGHGLGSLRHSVLGELSGKDETHS